MRKARLHNKKALPLRVLSGKKNRAQSVLEYAAVVACMVAALLAMQVYMRRSMQGRLRQVANSLGQQYAPGQTTGDSTLIYNVTSTTRVLTLSEQQLNTDLDGDGVLEVDVFGTETVSILGRHDDSNNDGIIQEGEISGGSTTIQRGSETVEAIKPEESLFNR